MNSQTWYEPPPGASAPVVGDTICTPLGNLSVIEIVEQSQSGLRYLLRLEGDDPQPCE